MSWTASAWALTVETGSPGAKLVLLCLANEANEDGECWPHQETIAKFTEMSLDTVQRRLTDLEQIGVISRQKRAGNGHGRRADLYCLHMAKPQNAAMPDKGRKMRSCGGGKTANEGGAKPQSCGLDIDEPTIEPTKTPSLRSGVSASVKSTRLDAGWKPSESGRQLAFAEGFTDAEITRIADSFRDYWLSKPGSQARKLDWEATWRNWVRREADNRLKSPHGRPSRNGFVDLLMELEQDERTGDARSGTAVPNPGISPNGNRADDRSNGWWEGDFAPRYNGR